MEKRIFNKTYYRRQQTLSSGLAGVSIVFILSLFLSQTNWTNLLIPVISFVLAIPPLAAVYMIASLAIYQEYYSKPPFLTTFNVIGKLLVVFGIGSFLYMTSPVVGIWFTIMTILTLIFAGYSVGTINKASKKTQ